MRFRQETNKTHPTLPPPEGPCVIPGGFAVVGAAVCANTAEFDAIIITTKAANFMRTVSRPFSAWGPQITGPISSAPNSLRFVGYRQAVTHPCPTLIHISSPVLLSASVLQPLIMNTGGRTASNSGTATSDANNRSAGEKAATAAPATKTRRSTIMRLPLFRFPMRLLQTAKIGRRVNSPSALSLLQIVRWRCRSRLLRGR
jgi:hypothetical protein